MATERAVMYSACLRGVSDRWPRLHRNSEVTPPGRAGTEKSPCCPLVNIVKDLPDGPEMA